MPQRLHVPGPFRGAGASDEQNRDRLRVPAAAQDCARELSHCTVRSHPWFLTFSLVPTSVLFFSKKDFPGFS